MSAFHILPLHPDYRLEILAPFSYSLASTAAQVEKIWVQEQQKKGGSLTNGVAYSLSEYRPDCLLIQRVDYKHVLARRRSSDLATTDLAIRPLAVTGLLFCVDGLVLGRRSDHVASDAGLWEPVPAGGLATLDPNVQLLEELKEELGLNASQIVRPWVCGLVEDMASGVVDIVSRIDTSATVADIRCAHRDLATKEYSELAIVQISDIVSFITQQQDRLLPALPPMLRLAGLLT